jgi:quinol monooxygenase YgiN
MLNSTTVLTLCLFAMPCSAQSFDAGIFGPSVEHTPLEPRTVLITFEAKPGEEETLKSLLEEAVGMSHYPEGARIHYKLHQATENPRKFFLYEQWRNEEVRANRSSKPPMKEIQARVSEVVVKPYEVTFATEL